MWITAMADTILSKCQWIVQYSKPFRWSDINEMSDEISRYITFSLHWRVLSVTGYQITGNSTVRLAVCSSFIKENIKAPHHWLFVRGIHRWPVDFPLKVPVLRKAFTISIVIMFRFDYNKVLSAKCFLLFTNCSARVEVNYFVQNAVMYQ